jgi:IS5 family transposase
MSYISADFGLVDLLIGRRKVKETFFSQINKIIDWRTIERMLENIYSKGKARTGRQPYAPIVLFRIELMRVWFGLSDGEVEEQVGDRISFTRFAGIPFEQRVPDSTTVCRFRNELVRANAYEALLNEINRQLERQEILIKTGVLVDASITPTPHKPRCPKIYELVAEDRNEEASLQATLFSSAKQARDKEVQAQDVQVVERAQKGVDKEGAWIRKGNKLAYGYKRHCVTDEQGLVLSVETTAANQSDIKHLQTPLEKAKLRDGTPVKADKGYKSAENDKLLADMKLGNHIMQKASKNHPLTEAQKVFNRGVSRVRYRIERTFGSIKCWFGGGIARYWGLAKTHAQHLMEAIAYNLYRSPCLYINNEIAKAQRRA